MEGLKTKRREGQGNLATCGCIWIGLFHSHPLDPTVTYCQMMFLLVCSGLLYIKSHAQNTGSAYEADKAYLIERWA
jgi:hypothetical protein